jgi:CubicO group peptidase (beta-lactamase class C family)
VHDPTARYMGGVAGHAGLLTTAVDLMIYADMLLGNGQRAGVRLLSPLIVKEFTSPATPANQPILFGLASILTRPFPLRGAIYFPLVASAIPASPARHYISTPRRVAIGSSSRIACIRVEHRT